MIQRIISGRALVRCRKCGTGKLEGDECSYCVPLPEPARRVSAAEPSANELMKMSQERRMRMFSVVVPKPAKKARERLAPEDVRLAVRSLVSSDEEAEFLTEHINAMRLSDHEIRFLAADRGFHIRKREVKKARKLLSL